MKHHEADFREICNKANTLGEDYKLSEFVIEISKICMRIY